MKLHFALDFDGTISPIDTTDFLLAEFAESRWQDIEAAWRAGRIGSRECLARQIALLRATPEALRAALSQIALDPHVAAFVAAVRQRGATVSVVSDGFDFAIDHLLKAHGLDLPVTSNRLVQTGEDRWQAVFSNNGGRCASGTCKCTAVPSDRRVILVGDGRSDYCLARRADFVLAKGSLAVFCTAEGIPHHTITGFADILGMLDSLFTAAPRSDLPRHSVNLGGLHA